MAWYSPRRMQTSEARFIKRYRHENANCGMKIDAHQHFWQINRNDYGWLTKDMPEIFRDFLPGDLRSHLLRANVGKTILIQAAPTDVETRFLIDIARSTSFVAGVVGWVDFDSPDALHKIDQLSINAELVGLRPMLQDLPASDWILNSHHIPVLRAMVATGLRFDALINTRHIQTIKTLATKHPDLKIVIDHAAKPPICGDMTHWERDIASLAAETDVYCKLSGLATEAGPNWTAQTFAPVFEVLMDCFGPRRLIWGSDWPVLNLNGGYERWHDTTEQLLANLQDNEVADIFGGNAERFYGLE